MIALAAIVPLQLLRGYVLAQLWRWFVVPLGGPAVDVVHAIGISLLVAMLTHQSPPKDAAKWSTAESIGISVTVSLLFWGMGAITKVFI